jgi:enoyl-CoA hydratase/carnithine racemase
MIARSLDAQVLTLWLDRPQAANALNAALHAQLLAQLADAAADCQVKAVVLGARGAKAFSAGADTREFAEMPRFSAELERRKLLLHTLQQMLDFPKPLVCAVGGPAIGAGAMLALACDEILMADSAWLQFPEIDFDLPSPVGIELLLHRANPAVARMLVQHGVRMDATQALHHALVDVVVPHAQLAEAASARAHERCARSGAAYAANKAWLHRALKQELVVAAAHATEFAKVRYDGPQGT